MCKIFFLHYVFSPKFFLLFIIKKINIKKLENGLISKDQTWSELLIWCPNDPPSIGQKDSVADSK